MYVLGKHRPEGTPDHVVVDADPARLLDRLREQNKGGDVHLVGGQRTIETVHALGALDQLGLMVLPILTKTGRRLTPELSAHTSLALTGVRQWPGGVVELSYDLGSTKQ